MMHRVVRARYPNVGQVEFVLGAMQVHNHCIPATSAENFNFFLRNCSSSRTTGWSRHTTLLPTTRSSQPLHPATIQRMDFFRHSGLGCVTHHTSHITHHTSHITHHISHITRHTSRITPHTSHFTLHASQIDRRTHLLTSHRWAAFVRKSSLRRLRTGAAMTAKAAVPAHITVISGLPSTAKSHRL